MRFISGDNMPDDHGERRVSSMTSLVIHFVAVDNMLITTNMAICRKTMDLHRADRTRDHCLVQ